MTIILNYDQLISKERSFERKILLDLLEEGLRASDPIEAVKRNFKICGREIIIQDKHRVALENIDRIIIIGAGKASGKMALGLEEVINDEIYYEGIVTVPHGIRTKLNRIKVLEGDHPIPSDRNVENTMRILDLVRGKSEKDLVIVLISGGGSALFTIPEDELELEDIIEMNKLLLKCGANIHEINIVRKHLCGVKGGKLISRYIYPFKTIALIISDVVGDDLDVIASGPTVLNRSTPTQAKMILMKYDLWNEVPIRVKNYIEKLILRGDWIRSEELFSNVINVVIASNIQSLNVMRESAVKKGYNTLILSSRIQGEAREVGKVLGGILIEVRETGNPIKPPAVLIAGGETTVTVKGKGLGGRNQELALSLAKTISGKPKMTFASMGSDGIDGNTDAAGAIVDDETIEDGRRIGLNEDEYLHNNDTYNYFKNLGKSLINTGITETNINDLMVGIVIK